MKNFFIIHGTDGHSQENWFPWMKQQLESRGYECIVPDFPCEDGHQLSKWYGEMDKYKDNITEETIFIAHSRGVSFILNLLTDFNYKIDSLYMIGGFIDYLWQKPNTPPTSFFAKPFDYMKIKKQCSRFVNYQSDNDPYIPVEHGKKVSDVLNARYEFIPNAGHFNTAAGYTAFDVLLDDILGESEDKLRIIRENIDGYNYFQNTLEILSADELQTPNILGHWGVKEIIAHLSGWETIVLGEIEQILEDRLPDTVGIPDQEVDRINIEEVNKRKGLSFEETVQDWRNTFKNLHEKLETLSADDYSKVVSKLDRSTSIKEIFDYRYEGFDHTTAHAKQIRGFFNKE
ncbi:MAG TPA: alpha/beta hydrolase [Candidatus Dojkabacteria bacterium]|nr:alpha/beta hydrolase [Candidatus Dojkabacteria bacterium]